MDFELANLQKQIRLAARELAESQWVPIGKEDVAKEKFPREIFTKAARLSFASVLTKKEYGGISFENFER